MLNFAAKLSMASEEVYQAEIRTLWGHLVPMVKEGQGELASIISKATLIFDEESKHCFGLQVTHTFLVKGKSTPKTFRIKLRATDKIPATNQTASETLLGYLKKIAQSYEAWEKKEQAGSE